MSISKYLPTVIRLDFVDNSSTAQISNAWLTLSNLKLLVGYKVLHYTLVKEKATWWQNPKVHKNVITSQEVNRFSVYNDDYKIMFLYHLVG